MPPLAALIDNVYVHVAVPVAPPMPASGTVIAQGWVIANSKVVPQPRIGGHRTELVLRKSHNIVFMLGKLLQRRACAKKLTKQSLC